MKRIKVLFVCTGNICRSPAAEEIFRSLIQEFGAGDEFIIDSAGTHGYHEGELPDRRMREHAFARGYRLISRSRSIRTEDFWEFDYIIDMDDNNRCQLNRKAPDEESRRKIHRMTDYCKNFAIDHVPDPYYGGSAGFERVLDILEDACRGLLIQIRI